MRHREREMEELKEDVERLLTEACDFQALSLQSRQNASVEYRKKETEAESYVRIVIDGLMARLASNMKEKVAQVDEKVSYQIALSASYVRTHFVINDLILSGDLVEAMTLVRKQLESLARLHELDDKPLQKLLRKTPNVINTLKAVGKGAYPKLSEIAHFASPNAAELLHVIEDGDKFGPSMIPVYTKSAHGCFDFQALVALYFLFWFVNKQKTLYLGFEGSSEEHFLYSALQAAIDAGMVRTQGGEPA